ncbi:hypothetical protein [Necropsobacter massiliensis]|uniref:hypothetical protein n=1 Tax=Necropsobacter massiliensis TaxID=1400001 RepID=UPI0006941191|nr:hypothetical protein [Necropsobacter massiliensis]
MRAYIAEHGEANISGDPQKIAAAVYDLTQQANPRLRTALGSDTYATLEQAYAKQLQTLQEQEELAVSVVMEGKAGFMPNS